MPTIARSCDITRRQFMQHLAGAAAWTLPAASLAHSLQVHAKELRRQRKGAILVWLGGGASTLDMWDLKPGAATGGPFRPMASSGPAPICEHLPLIAQRMHQLSLVRSMSTREADHGRGRYYLHTGYPPDRTVQHPSYGSLVAHELALQQTDVDLKLPPFISIGGVSEGPGFLGMSYAPFVVSPTGQVSDLDLEVDVQRFRQRVEALQAVEEGFIGQQRGPAAEDHAKILARALDLITTSQREAFQIEREPAAALQRYGDNNLGRSCLMARRLIEAGVPFVEVDYGGWDHHANIFASLQNDKLPALDRALSGLVEDLVQRGMWEHTAVICLGEFGRTPRINANGGRDHWARCWSVVVGGAGFTGGRVIGQTNADGTQIEGDSYSAEDLMASVCHALGIPLEKTFKTPSGRPMKIANGGQAIAGLFG